LISYSAAMSLWWWTWFNDL